MKAIKTTLKTYSINFLRTIVVPHKQMIALILTSLLTTYFYFNESIVFYPKSSTISKKSNSCIITIV